MSRYLELPDSWGPRLSNQAETGMGYQTASVTLRDGRIFEDVLIIGGTVAEVRGFEEIPFSVDELSDITVTHRKWHFVNETFCSTRALCLCQPPNQALELTASSLASKLDMATTFLMHATCSLTRPSLSLSR